MKTKINGISDLKTGMQVETSGGLRYIVLLDTAKGDIIKCIHNEGWLYINEFMEDMTSGSLKIVRVYECKYAHKYLTEMEDEFLIWERSDVVSDDDLIVGHTYKLVGENGISDGHEYCKFLGYFDSVNGKMLAFDGECRGKFVANKSNHKWQITKV